MVDDERMPLAPGEQVQTRVVRFRTLGCYPLTGAIESTADDVCRRSSPKCCASRDLGAAGPRRSTTTSGASMEQKKQEGYF